MGSHHSKTKMCWAESEIFIITLLNLMFGEQDNLPPFFISFASKDDLSEESLITGGRGVAG